MKLIKTIPTFHPAVFLLLGAVIFWGLNFHEGKIMLRYVHFIEVGFWRYLFGAGFLFLFVISTQKKIPWQIVRQKYKGITLVGVIGLFLFNVFFLSGLHLTSALNAALIIGLTPATTLLLSNLLLKTPITAQQKIGIVIAFTGVVFLLTKGQPTKLLYIEWSIGDLLILGANLMFALQNIWIKQYAQSFDNTIFTFLTNAICFIGFVLLLPVVGVNAPPLAQYDFWLSAIGIGLFGSCLAYLFWNKGIQGLGAENGAIFSNAIPLTTAFFAIFFGEYLEIYHLISGALILSGVLYVQLQK